MHLPGLLSRKWPQKSVSCEVDKKDRHLKDTEYFYSLPVRTSSAWLMRKWTKRENYLKDNKQRNAVNPAVWHATRWAHAHSADALPEPVGIAGGGGCAVAEQAWLITTLSEQLWFHTGLSKLSKLLSALLLPCVCFILLLHPLSACIDIYSPHCLAQWVSQPPSVSLILCLDQIAGKPSCWVSSAWGLYKCCSMLGCLRANQKCPGLPFLIFLTLFYQFW